MKKNCIFRAALSFMAAALVLSSCTREDIIPEGPETTEANAVVTIPYTVTVSGEPETRATVDGDMKTLRFAEGDKLYVVGFDDQAVLDIQGVLDIQTGVGESSGATFSGKLTYTGKDKMPDNFLLYATLVSAQQRVGREVSVSEKGGVSVNYPKNEYCETVEEAVRRYSDLSGLGVYSMKSFTLNQRTAFLNFEMIFEDGTPAGTEVSAVVTADRNDDPLCTASVTTREEGGKVVARFVLPKTRSSLSYASVKLDARDAIPFGGSLMTLEGKVYNVTKTVDFEGSVATMPLTVEALTAGTVKVYIDGTLSSGMKYSVNGGEKTLITNSTDVNVSAGDKVQFYGNGTATQTYGDDPAVKIQGSEGFTCKVYGNIMSLLDEDGFVTRTDLPDRSFVFSGLFMDNIALTDASSLRLPATTLAPGCYLGMFQGCTALTTAPNLLATSLAPECYLNMFQGCTNLSSVKCLATSGITGNNSTLDWLDGVASTGTFYPASESRWPVGVSGAPRGWAVEYPDGRRINDYANLDLSTIDSNYTAVDGQTLIGTLGGRHKISIGDGATVTLADVTIHGVNDTRYMWAGINLEGDGTIILKDGTANTVNGSYDNYPGIHVPVGKTLTIKGEAAGTGSLVASSGGYGAGIGGGDNMSCGNIVIRSGVITAKGGNHAAGIGSGGGEKERYSHCGNIDILGGTVTAIGGEWAAGIGTGFGGGISGRSTCGDIFIAKTVTSVTATKGRYAPFSIGPGQSGTCGTVTVEPGANVTYN